MNCFGYNEDYSQGYMKESRRGDGRFGISGKCKGNVLSLCVTPAYMNALEAMAVTEKELRLI